MKLHRTIRYTPELFSLVPLVNVLFLVVAMVALSNTFVLRPGISVTLPFSSFALGPERNSQIISITAGPEPVIYFHDRRVTQEELDGMLAQSGIKERSLIVRADQAVPFDLVSRVMNIGLQRGYSVAIAASTQAP